MVTRSSPPETLVPDLDLLREEYVLVQAWKKTANYIRRYNWFSDPLELDLAAVTFPDFLRKLQTSLSTPEQWQSDPLSLVLAPKAQRWGVQPDRFGPAWQPVFPVETTPTDGQELTPDFNMRPLAHVSLRDQVVATALLLCIADRVETEQGNPDPETGPDASPRYDSRMISHGHRLLCYGDRGVLHHAWGARTLYREYSTDYKLFLDRPERMARQCLHKREGRRVFIVACDCSRFYDRIRPADLAQALARLQRPTDDPRFFDLAARVLSWNWLKGTDSDEAENYARVAGIEDYSCIALPQGLASAGFWSNVVLLRLDELLRRSYTDDLQGIRIEDVSRYVDDIRIVISTDRSDLGSVEQTVTTWLEALLKRTDLDLRLNDNKLEMIEQTEEGLPTIPHRHRMAQIQTRVSGGFAAGEGEDLLGLIENLLNARRDLGLHEESPPEGLEVVPDVPDATAARFAARRFQTVATATRDLIPEGQALAPHETIGTYATPTTRQTLDASTRAFARRLVEIWTRDPSNVRVLLTGFDLWPDAELLSHVLDLLRAWLHPAESGAAAQVAQYCLSEVFRAGATRTGLSWRADSPPDGVDLESYRRRLADEALFVLSPTLSHLPWYLRQQALLFLIGYPVAEHELADVDTDGLSPHHTRMLAILRRGTRRLPREALASHLLILHHCFPRRDHTFITAMQEFQSYLPAVAALDPAFAVKALRDVDPRDHTRQSRALARRLLLDLSKLPPDSLACLVIGRRLPRNESTILRLALEVLKSLRQSPIDGPLPPWRVRLTLTEDGSLQRLTVRASPRLRSHAQFEPPDWAPDDTRWRFQVGYLLRFALTRNVDFTTNANLVSARPGVPFYRSSASHWLQRKYGSFNALRAFGGDWLAITEWTERFLSALLHWPGRAKDEHSKIVESGIDETIDHVSDQLDRLAADVGSASGTQFLTMTASAKPVNDATSLQVCIAQSILPRLEDVRKLRFDHEDFRRRHRNHLQDMLLHVRSALRLRRAHIAGRPVLDWLILPELAVHPEDVELLADFAREFRALVLAGVTYEDVEEAQGLANTAIWLIPEVSSTGGLRIVRRRQGKYYPTKAEEELGPGLIKRYRPCQWLINLPQEGGGGTPLRISASVCYDATDLDIVADLRNRADVYVIPALNKDVNTFDNLSVALNYHMFQMVIVANSGEFGGSSVYFPHVRSYRRRVLHLHGGEQATLGFFEVRNVRRYLARRVEPHTVFGGDETERESRWKKPPAGYRRRRT